MSAEQIQLQQDHCAWWRANVRGPGRHGNSRRSGEISDEQAEALTGITSQQTSKWAAKLKDATIRAARVLETAVGAALGETVDIGGRGNKGLLANIGLAPDLGSRFRLMYQWRHAWLPALIEKPLSRKQVLRLIEGYEATLHMLRHAKMQLQTKLAATGYRAPVMRDEA